MTTAVHSPHQRTPFLSLSGRLSQSTRTCMYIACDHASCAIAAVPLTFQDSSLIPISWFSLSSNLLCLEIAEVYNVLASFLSCRQGIFRNARAGFVHAVHATHNSELHLSPDVSHRRLHCTRNHVFAIFFPVFPNVCLIFLSHTKVLKVLQVA